MTDRRNVVVVEDNTDVAFLIGMQLDVLVDIVGIFHCAEEALAWPHWDSVDLAVIDWRIPGGGTSVVQFLAEEHPHVTRLLTSSGTPPARDVAHADAFVSKAKLRDLTAAVERLMRVQG